MGRMPHEMAHNASRRIQQTEPYNSHRHEHLPVDMVPRSESPVNRRTRERHVLVSGTGQTIGRVVGAQRQKRLDRGTAKII
jgi:hypothetical protein